MEGNKKKINVGTSRDLSKILKRILMEIVQNSERILIEIVQNFEEILNKRYMQGRKRNRKIRF